MNDVIARWATEALRRCIERARAMAAAEFARLADELRGRVEGKW